MPAFAPISMAIFASVNRPPELRVETTGPQNSMAWWRKLYTRQKLHHQTTLRCPLAALASNKGLYTTKRNLLLLSRRQAHQETGFAGLTPHQKRLDKFGIVVLDASTLIISSIPIATIFHVDNNTDIYLQQHQNSG